MTTGFWSAGANPSASIDSPFFSKKYWQGGDGRVIPGRVSRKLQWNDYSMGHLKYKKVSNLTGLRNPATKVISVYQQVRPGVDNLVASSAFPRAYFDARWTANYEYKLQAKLLKKVKGHAYNMGVSLAEVDKLAGSVLGTIKTLTYGMLDLASGNWARFARRLGTGPPSKEMVRRLQAKDITGRFLEWRYAWSPVIDDAYESAKAFEELSNGPRQQIFKAVTVRKIVESVPGNYHDGLDEIMIGRCYTYEMYEELGAFRQMGLANPASILWERVPWSFVFDWFIPVGNYLELIGQIPYMNGRWLRSDFIRRTFSGWDQGLNAGTAPYWEPAPPWPLHEISSFQIERKVTFSAPSVPRPELNVAGAIHGKRIQNALSLAYQLVDKRLRKNLSVIEVPDKPPKNPGDTWIPPDVRQYFET